MALFHKYRYKLEVLVQIVGFMLDNLVDPVWIRNYIVVLPRPDRFDLPVISIGDWWVFVLIDALDVLLAILYEFC